jgi:hypothetical protein
MKTVKQRVISLSVSMGMLTTSDGSRRTQNAMTTPFESASDSVSGLSRSCTETIPFPRSRTNIVASHGVVDQ